ncbi:copper chaperone PCu(A)C [Pigmentiphaga kullae]|uniref:Copper(I)-binding protein n=1 Tax=Pigmentiphaga kullae TaxID=151784 RepID=A0A4Q7NJ49_9BURK|nr:copper chaperone PCu(A)C [Pigmentiphaga kullae]RZS84852.1 copper(I)-binding protein [Pigmentiphaga kullae]
MPIDTMRGGFPRQCMRTWCALALVASTTAVQAAPALSVDTARVRLGSPPDSALAFMQLRAGRNLFDIRVASPFAASVAVREMVRAGGQITIEPVPDFSMKTQETATLELAPGHRHLLLRGVKPGLRDRRQIPLTLTYALEPGGRRHSIQVPARVIGPRRGADDALDIH